MQRLIQLWLIFILSPAIILCEDNRDDRPQVVGVVGVWNTGEGKRIHFGEELKYSTDVICTEGGSLTILLDEPFALRCESKGARTKIKDFADAHKKSIRESFARFLELAKVEISQRA